MSRVLGSTSCSQPDATSAKHASTRRPGAILRAAERLVLAAAVEDAAASDAIEAMEGDGSLGDQPPGGSDDTRLEARFREPDVFDALFLREKETDGETNLPWWSKMVPVDLPSESAVDLDLAHVSACRDETFDRDVAAPPSADCDGTVAGCCFLSCARRQPSAAHSRQSVLPVPAREEGGRRAAG